LAIFVIATHQFSVTFLFCLKSGRIANRSWAYIKGINSNFRLVMLTIILTTRPPSHQ